MVLGRGVEYAGPTSRQRKSRMNERTTEVRPRWSLPTHDYWSTPFAESLLQHLDLRPGVSILDIASGHGIPAFYLAEQVGLPDKSWLSISAGVRWRVRERSKAPNFRGCGLSARICVHCLHTCPVSIALRAIFPSCFFVPTVSKPSRDWWNTSNLVVSWC